MIAKHPFKKGLKMEELMTATKGVFVKPHFIPELGCEGLSAGEIAQSLGIQAKHVREKLGPRGDMDKLLELLGGDVSQGRVASATQVNLACVRMAWERHPVTDLPYEDYYLTTAAAKLFVARYQNDTGEAYLAYLIRLDVAVEKNMEVERQRQIAQRQVLQLQEGLEEANKRCYELTKRLNTFIMEPASDHDYEALKKALEFILKKNCCYKPKYKQMITNDVANRYYRDEQGKRLDYLPQRNFKAALMYIERLDWDYFGPLLSYGIFV